MKLNAFKEKYQVAIDEECRVNFRNADTKIQEAMDYALSTGGKRVRPLLTVAFTQALGGNVSVGLKLAPTVEFVHTYSLIHDDLPAMDNDDYRRGQLSVHKKFDEATAILTGDALLTYAFQYLAQLPDIDAEKKVTLIQMLATAAGESGMVEGQMRDMMSEGKHLTLDQLMALDRYKTGELINYSILSAALIADVSKSVFAKCVDFATNYGTAYQIQNDLQEVLWTDEKRGKHAHGDTDAEKNTYPSLLGIDGAKAALNKHIQACQHNLKAIEDAYTKFDRELVSGFLDYLEV